MYQGFPQTMKHFSLSSTISRLFSRILLPCVVLLTTLLIFPWEGHWSGAAWLAALSASSGTGYASLSDAVPSGTAVPDSYEVYQAGDYARSAWETLEQEILQAEFSRNTLKLHCHFADSASYGLSADTVSLGHVSLEESAGQAEEARTFLGRLQEIPRESLSPEQQLAYDILEWDLTQSSQADRFAAFADPLSDGSGLLSELPVLLAEFTFRSQEDLEIYLALLADFPRYFSELLSFAGQKVGSGVPINARQLSRCIDACTAFCKSYAADPENHFLVLSFENALADLDFLPSEQIPAYITRNRSLLAESVIPSYQQLAAGLEALLTESALPSDQASAADAKALPAESDSSLETATRNQVSDTDGSALSSLSGETDSNYLHTAAGLCSIPGGADYYRYLIVSRVGTSRSGEELIEWITDRMVSDIRAMDELYQTNPEISQDIAAASLLTDPQLILIDLQSKMRNDFPVLSGAACRIRWIPEVLEDLANPAFYLVPPMDAPEESCIYLNGSRLNASNLYLTMAHEGYPGHLYQTVYFSSVSDDPLRCLFSLPGYSEGWATYAERQAYYYIDGYSEAAAEFLCRNASAAMALYALCDLNVHLNGWTPSDLSHFLQVWVNNVTEDMVTTLYDTIIADPANYLCYHVGALELEALREEGEERLGDTFDCKDFHAFLLQTGPCPFDILRKQFEEWLKNAATA